MYDDLWVMLGAFALLGLFWAYIVNCAPYTKQNTKSLRRENDQLRAKLDRANDPTADHPKLYAGRSVEPTDFGL